MAAKIGAINTLVRGPDGRLKGYNTDVAAISAIESQLSAESEPDCDEEGCSLDFDDMEAGPSDASASDNGTSPLQGLRVVIVGAGGSGRALAFGAAAKGAQVILANRRVPHQLLHKSPTEISYIGSSALLVQTYFQLPCMNSAAVSMDSYRYCLSIVCRR